MADDMKEYMPEFLRDAASQIMNMRNELLFSVGLSGADPESEQFFLLALSALESARGFMAMASMKQSQALAGGRR